MKKKLVGILATIACLACFSSCAQLDGVLDTVKGTVGGVKDKITALLPGGEDKKEEETQKTSLDAAKSYLDSIYKENDGAFTVQSFNLMGIVPIKGANGTEKIAVEWKADTEAVEIVKNEDGSYTVNILNTEPEDVITYKLTATVSDGKGNTLTSEFTRKIPKMPKAESTLTIKEILALQISGDTVSKYYVKGKISEVYNTTYGNMYLVDEEGNKLTIYGTYSADGSKRYDKMDVKPVAGDEVTIYSILSVYNGTNQMKNGWIVEHEAAFPVVTDDIATQTAPPKDDGTATPDTSYVTRTTTNGWVATNSAAQAGPKEEMMVEDEYAFILNGKTTAPGTLTSPVVENIKKISFNYGFTYGDTQFSMTISVKNEAGDVVASKTLDFADLTKSVRYDYNWELETPVEGKCTIEFVNTCKSESTKNKDRLAIWNVTVNGELPVVDFGGEEETPVAPSYTAITTAPAANVAYTYFANDSASGKTYYFAGYTSGYYFQATDDATKAVSVYAEAAADGAFYLYFLDANGAKQYMNTYASGTYVNNKVVTNVAEATAYTFNTQYNVAVVAIDGTDYYLGWYNNSWRASKLSYAATSAVGNFAAPASTPTAITTAPVANVKYNYAASIDGKTYYFAGYTSGYYFQATEDATKAVSVYAEAAANGAFYLYFLDANGVKQYMNTYASGTYVNNKVVTNVAEATAYTFNTQYNVAVVTIDGTDYYLGWYNNSWRASKLSYAATSAVGNFFVA